MSKNQQNMHDACQKKFNQIDQKIDDLQKAVAQNSCAEVDESIVNSLSTLTDTVGGLSTTVGQHTQSISALQTSKQNTLTAGVNISISGNTISATDTTYTAGTGISISNNVISATGGGLTAVTASDFDSEQATSGKVLTADGNGGANWEDSSGMTQEQIEKLDLVYQDYLSRQTPADPNYSPKTFSDYPAGTIVKSYDYCEYFVDVSSSSNSYKIPETYFCCETSCAGQIKFKINSMLKSSATSVLIKTYLNNEIIDTDTISYNNTNEIVSFEKTIYDVNFNTENKGNNIYFTLSYSGNSNILGIKYVKVEIVAPNADILIKENNFDAYSFDSNYYLTNCTNGNVKLAQISSANMNNMDDIVWTNTNFDAIYCKACGSFTRYGNEVVPNQIRYISYNSKFLNYVGSENNFQMCAVNYPNSDLVEFADDRINFLSINKSDGKIYKQGYDVSGNTFYYTSGMSSINNLKLIGCRYLNCLNMSKNFYPNVLILKDGICYLRTGMLSSSKSILIGYGSDATLYITDYFSDSNFKAIVFLKKYDKIIRYDYAYSSAGFSLLSQVEIGTYQKFFLMPNNDYFVIKNNELSYYKFNNQE